MLLTKAIEIVSDSANRGITTFNEDYKTAQRLLIGAGKWRLLMERDYGSWCGPLLPGETEEEQPTRDEVKKYMAEREQRRLK